MGESLRIISCLIVLLAGSIHGQDSVDVSQSVIQAGESTVLTCRVTAPPLGTQLTWGKKQHEGDPESVGFGNILDSKYDGLGRMEVIQSVEDNTLISKLTLSNAQYEDSGSYGCAASAGKFDPENAQWATVAVADPVKAVVMRAVTEEHKDNPEEHSIELVDGEEIEVPDDGKYYFRCEFYGSNPAPDVMVTFGGNDITDTFVIQPEEALEASADDGDLQTNYNLNYIRYSSTVTSSEPVHVDTSHRRQKFICMASVVGQDPPASITVTPFMKASAELSCEQEVVIARLDEKDVTLTCKVVGNPVVENGIWSWVLFGGAREELKVGEPHNDIRATVSEDPDDADSRIFNLQIKYVRPSHFRAYNLTIEDENGRVDTARIILERDYTGESTSQASMTTIWTPVLLLAAMALTFLGM